MANFQPFDLGRAVNAGTQNAIAMMQARQLGDEFKDRRVLRETATEASQPMGHPGIDQTAGGYDAGRHAELLGERGRPMMANQISQMHQQRQAGDIGLDLKRLEFATKTIPMIRDERSYDLWKGKAEQFGIIEPGQLPDQYDNNAQAALKELQGKTAGALKVLSLNLPGGKQQQYFQQGDDLTPVGEPVDRWKPPADGDGSGMKAADENAMYRQAAGLYGGTWDPQTGRVLGLNREQSAQVQAIAERASMLYYRREAQTRSEAVTMAARELGIDVRDLGGETEDKAAFERAAKARTPAAEPAPEPAGEVIRYDINGNRID